MQVNNQQGNSKLKYEKIKKNLKYLPGLAGTGSIVAIVAKLIYDKTHHYNYKEKIINGIILSITNQIWIAKNFFLCGGEEV